MNPLSVMIFFVPGLILKILAVFPPANLLTMLKIAMGLSLLICLYQARNAVKKFIFQGTLVFFAFTFVTLVLVSDMWGISYMGLVFHVTKGTLVWGAYFL